MLLDVDGVLNAVPFTGRVNRNVWSDYERTLAHDFPIHYSPTVVKFFHDLPDHVEVMWLTTWLDAANEHLVPALSLPSHWPVAGHYEHADETSVWWKLLVAQRLWEVDPLPFVWADDDLVDAEAQEWIETLPVGSCLPVCCNTSTGLTRHDLAAITEFVEAHRP
jgi:hypothetical protein